MITEEHDSKAKTFSFYCRYCFANTKSECYCNRIVGYYPGINADIPIVDIYEDEWDKYLSSSNNRKNKKDSENLESNPIQQDDKHAPEGSQSFLISEDVIQYLASLGDSDTASIIREGYAEEHNIPTSVVDTLVFRRILRY
jgi:hypothetical protein